MREGERLGGDKIRSCRREERARTWSFSFTSMQQTFNASNVLSTSRFSEGQPLCPRNQFILRQRK